MSKERQGDPKGNSQVGKALLNVTDLFRGKGGCHHDWEGWIGYDLDEGVNYDIRYHLDLGRTRGNCK